MDHSTPGRTRGLSATVTPDVVIDHHPGSSIDATVRDVRSDYGATVTIMVEYLQTLEVTLTERLATALLFALHRERLDFVRHPTRREYEAALWVYDRADLSLLAELYGSAFAPATVDAIGRAICSRHRRGSAIVASAGRTPVPDAMPQAADYLLNVEGVRTTLVYGLVDGTVRLSARTSDGDVNIGAVLEAAFGAWGAVGGHHDMGGGTIDLGVFDSTADDEAVLAVLEDHLPTQFFASLGVRAGDPQLNEA